jgi:hypothetical protein
LTLNHPLPILYFRFALLATNTSTSFTLESYARYKLSINSSNVFPTPEPTMIVGIPSFLQSKHSYPTHYCSFTLKLVPSTKTKSNCSSNFLNFSIIRSSTSPILPLFFFLISLLLLWQKHPQSNIQTKMVNHCFDMIVHFTILEIFNYGPKITTLAVLPISILIKPSVIIDFPLLCSLAIYIALFIFFIYIVTQFYSVCVFFSDSKPC